ncbi:MAG: arsinothricin resistance N-acetyltransferase ArsN1 family B [Streptosporangiaceae bacterium]
MTQAASTDGYPEPSTAAGAPGRWDLPAPVAGAGQIVVRDATPADAGDIAAIYAPVVGKTAISFEEAPPGPGEIARRMRATPRLPWLIADDAGRVAGYAYASAHRARPAYRWSADCSVYLDPRYRSRGLGRLLYEHLITEVASLGYISLFAGIALPNEASVGLHEAMGFRPVGVFRDVGYKLGAWRDVGWWQRPLCEAPPSPDEPLPWRS